MSISGIYIDSTSVMVIGLNCVKMGLEIVVVVIIFSNVSDMYRIVLRDLFMTLTYLSLSFVLTFCDSLPFKQYLSTSHKTDLSLSLQ